MKHTTICLFLLSLSFFACKDNENKFSDSWEWTGRLDSGVVFSFTIDHNDRLLAGTTEGLYHSFDNGKTWSRISLDIFDPDQDFRLIKADDKNNLLAGDFHGLLKSTNQGQNWQLLYQTTSGSYISAVASDSNGIMLLGETRGFFARSTNSGLNWETLASSSDGVTDIVMLDSMKIIASHKWGYIACSTDTGSTWQYSFTNPSAIYTLQKDSSGNLYAGGEYGLFKSTDTGASWQQTNLGYVIRKILVLSNHEILAASDSNGIFQSINAGESWKPLGIDLPPDVIWGVAMNSIHDIYISTGSNGFYRYRKYPN